MMLPLLQTTMPMNTNTNMNAGAGIVAILFTLLIVVVVVGLLLLVWGTIFKKAGYSFWMALLMLVPIANLVWLLVFAFSKWPIQVELERQRMDGATGGFPVMPPQQR